LLRSLLLAQKSRGAMTSLSEALAHFVAERGRPPRVGWCSRRACIGGLICVSSSRCAPITTLAGPTRRLHHPPSSPYRVASPCSARALVGSEPLTRASARASNWPGTTAGRGASTPARRGGRRSGVSASASASSRR
jgi:hypothetical protein